jgi:hypothetical protein
VYLARLRRLIADLEAGGDGARLAQPPYAARTGRDTLNANYSIFRPDMLVAVTSERDGYLGVVAFRRRRRQRRRLRNERGNARHANRSVTLSVERNRKSIQDHHEACGRQYRPLPAKTPNRTLRYG